MKAQPVAPSAMPSAMPTKVSTLRLVLASIATRPLATALNVLMLGLGLGCIVTLMLVGHQIEQRMEHDARGIDMVIGAKGSPMQLILAGIYHLDVPPGNIPKVAADEIAASPLVREVIPLALGDSFRGYRIVGAPPTYMALYGARAASGSATPKVMEAVLGAEVAQATGLQVGQSFAGSHGLAGGEEHTEAPYRVVGVLAATGTVIDRLVITPVESVWKVHDKVLDIKPGSEDAKIVEQEREVTLLLVRYASPLAAVMLPRAVNARTDVQAAVPAIELTRLYRIVGVGIDVIRAFAIVLVVAAALGLFATLLAALKEREADLAVLRLMGASRAALLKLTLLEGGLLALAGAALGLLLGHGATAGVGAWLAAQKSVPVTGAIWLPQELFVVGLALALGLAAALYPAWRAYRQEVSLSLQERI
jgi:putative ABC transport system permease protein